jgi:demethylmenaquinone methyltransferase/2-methoxy-6-polyprenyl-1,4-benzoquinol methylase
MSSSGHPVNPEKIQSMFAKVAGNYDRANTVLSLGIHHLWRKKLIQLSGAKDGQRVLDCATGTGDLAIEFKKAVGPMGSVTGTDFCPEMLASAPAKAHSKNLDIHFETADAMDLPYIDQQFDVVSISFGIRNVANPLKALKEMARVTRPGGKVMVLEFGQATLPIFAPVFNFYSEKVLPLIGGMITGQKEAYSYLQKSSAAFPCRENFLKLMNETGTFSETTFHSLTGGVAYIYVGTKKPAPSEPAH